MNCHEGLEELVQHPHYYTSVLDGFPCPDCEWGLIRESQSCPMCTDAISWRNYLDDIEEPELDKADCPTCYGTGEVANYETCATCAGTRLVPELPFSVPAAQLRLSL